MTTTIEQMEIRLELLFFRWRNSWCHYTTTTATAAATTTTTTLKFNCFVSIEIIQLLSEHGKSEGCDMKGETQ